MRITTSQKVVGGFGFGLLLLLVMGWFSYQTARNFITFSDTQRQNLQGLEQLALFQSYMKDAETGQRGYLLTGDEQYLVPFVKSMPGIEQGLNELRRLARGDAAWESRMATLRSLVEQKLAELSRTINIRKSDPQHGFARALAIVRTDRGKQLMDEIRATLLQIQQEIEQARDRSFHRSEQAAQRLIWLISLVSPITIVFVSFAGWLILRDLAARTRVETEVRRQRAVLETVLASMGEGIVVADAEGHFQIFNPMARQILGAEPSLDSFKSMSDYFHLFRPDGVTPFPEQELPLVRALRGESTDNVEMWCGRPARRKSARSTSTGGPSPMTPGIFTAGSSSFTTSPGENAWRGP